MTDTYDRAIEEARARGMSPPTPEHAEAFLRDVDAGFAPPVLDPEVARAVEDHRRDVGKQFSRWLFFGEEPW